MGEQVTMPPIVEAGLRHRQARLRWRVTAAWTLLMSATIGVPWLIIRAFGWAWWSVLLSFLLLGALAPVVQSVLPRWTSLARQAHGEWLLQQATQDPRPPILLLRSFTSAVTVEPTPTIRLFGEQRAYDEPYSPAAPRSHLLRMANWVKRHGPVVAIGTARRGVAMAPKVDVLMFEPGDDIWFDVFEILSRASRAVIMLPGETQSVGRELDSLKSRQLLPKLIVVMPPNGLFYGSMRVRIPISNDNLEHLQAGWETACEKFSSLGVSLPAYDPAGLAFTIDADGQVARRVPLQGSFVRLERAVETLVPAAEVDGMSLGETMRLLAPFDLAGD